ncbi:hypothetical protein RchiOBHm_Chr3g0488971 [Rosa chinensis]|uniref:Uncharacterized protein n=1 Tax=Rosa chinensis TaxID=74649 RepID=A0A2P6RFW7_ROSCH|nr:hypothetical protein RchiOBHm_Chr3g0488971 [Rosa chinensis]
MLVAVFMLAVVEVWCKAGRGETDLEQLVGGGLLLFISDVQEVTEFITTPMTKSNGRPMLVSWKKDMVAWCQ